MASATLLMAAAPAAEAQDRANGTAPTPTSATDLLSLSIEQLMNIEVTSVGKKPQMLSDAAAAVQVITQEEIRRSGMTSIPELLRMVPGLDVAQSDSRHWAVGSRGLNNNYSAKLLVLVDGRAVYTPSFSGVLWDAQDIPLEDIERIEVIRGAGGTLWGANAVNGVINVITKPTQDTQGLLVTAGTGTLDAGVGVIRYGGRLSDTASFRLYAKGFGHNSFETGTGADAQDSWRQGSAGFRVDWKPSSADTVMAQAEYYRQTANGDLFLPSPASPPAVETPTVEHQSGGHALVNWQHVYSNGSDLALQAYFDRAVIGEYTFGLTVDTYDVELKRHLHLGDRHDIVWGMGYRRTQYDGRNSVNLGFYPPSGHTQIFNIFGQDEFSLTSTLHLIGGIKVEHNTYTGFEYEPNLRLLWTPAANHTFWTAASRAIRMPAISEESMRFNITAIPGTPPALIAVFGNPGEQVSERVLSWEAGYRATLTPRLSIDTAVFFSSYARLASFTATTPFLETTPPPAHIVVPLRYGNLLHGKTYGAELSVRWQATSNWRLFAAYTLLRGNLRADQPGFDYDFQVNLANSSPKHQIQLRSSLDLPWHTELDAALYYVGAYQVDNIPAYTRLDVRIGWRPTEHLDISLVGQNLLDPRHAEVGRIFYRIPSEVPRSVFLKATANF